MATPQLDKKDFYNRVIMLSLPIAFQSLMLASVAAADALMLGRVAQAEMTAVSLATQIQFIQNMLLTGSTAAGMILGAQYFGKNDKLALRKILNIMLLFCGGISIVFFLLCEMIPELLMMIFTGDSVLIEIGSGYLRIAGISYLLTGISQSYLAIMKVTDHVKAVAGISTTAVVSNIILNAMFIFGFFGIPAMGACGAAIATAVSRAAELILCIGFSMRAGSTRPEMKNLFTPGKLLTKDFLKQCIPLIGGGMLWGIGFTAYTAIIGHMGSDAAASNSVAAVIRDLICCACNGIGGAASIIVGNALGAGKIEDGKQYGIWLKNLSWVIGLISMGIVLAITPIIVRVIILTPEAQQYLTGMMVIMAVYMIGRCVNTVTINGVLDGGGDTIFDMYSLIVSMWIVAIPIAFLGAFKFQWPVLVVYACTCIDEVGKIPWVMHRFRKYKWLNNLTR